MSSGVIQWSVGRSGSTLIRRVLEYLLGDVDYQHPRDVPMAHLVHRHPDLMLHEGYNPFAGLDSKIFGDLHDDGYSSSGWLAAAKKMVCTVRHPIDILASLLRINDEDIEELLEIDMLSDYANKLSYSHLNFWNRIEVQAKDNVLILKYESFWNNFDYIFDKLENFFQFKIPEQDKKNIEDKFCIKSHLKIQKKIEGSHSKNENLFDTRDKESHIHGGHIANPQPGDARSIFDGDRILFLENTFKEYIQNWESVE
jgi:hypothetical protein